MNESVGIPRLLQNARIERGIDLESMSKKTGVAMNHLLDIEAGRSSGFHSPAYCRKAVMMIARELDLEPRVAELCRIRTGVVRPSRCDGFPEWKSLPRGFCRQARRSKAC